MPFALTCTTCSRPLTFVENLTNRSIQRCNACERRFRGHQEDILEWIEEAFLEPAGITLEMEQEIYMLLAAFSIPTGYEEPILSRLGYVRSLSKIRQGDFPHVRTDLILDTDEYAHFEIQARSVRPGDRVRFVPGRLIGTNKRIYFIADSGKGSATMSWGNVSQAKEKTLEVPDDEGYTTTYELLRILVSRGPGGGDYDVPDPLYAKTIIEALVKRWRRHLVEKYTTDGVVPDYVKAQVHHRDGGRCVECGFQDPYIEYDHKIPRSKGGPNTVENIQLLCRGCNRKKSNKVDAAYL